MNDNKRRKNAERMRNSRKKWEEAGLCITCGKNRPESGYKSCKACRERRKSYYLKHKKNPEFIERLNIHHKEQYWLCKENGICTKCHAKDAVAGQSLCADCREKAYARRRMLETSEKKEKRSLCKKRLYYYRKENGLCTKCGKKALQGRCLCQSCRIYINQYQHGYNEHTHDYWVKERKAGRL